MLKTFARAAAVAAALLCATAALAQKSFVRDDLASEGVRLEEKLKTEAGSTAAGRPAAQLRRDAEGLMSRSNQRGAMSLYAAAVALEPKNAANWVGFVKAAQGDHAQGLHGALPAPGARHGRRLRRLSARDDARRRGRGARPPRRSLRHERGLAAGAQRLSRRASQLADEPAVRKTYEELREKHGFRITNYKVDSDSASPRVCFQFSEPLAQRAASTSRPSLRCPARPTPRSPTEGSQLCVDGLKHGERYAFVLRQGLPSSVGESLLKSADYEVYVRDRSPQVRFTGRNYVLPRTGQEGIPVVSVNTASVEVEIYRIGDRNLLPTVRSEEFLGQISRSAAETIATEKGREDLVRHRSRPKSELNRDVVTAFPVTEAVGKLEPGVYVMIARPDRAPRRPRRTTAPAATQWFVVSDLGLTAFKGKDGVHVLVRSLATRRAARQCRGPPRRPQQRGAGDEVDRCRRPCRLRSRARARRGRHRAGPVVAATGEDYGFLDLGSRAFDLTDRGVKGRVAPGAVDAYRLSPSAASTAPARRCS